MRGIGKAGREREREGGDGLEEWGICSTKLRDRRPCSSVVMMCSR